MGGTLVVAEHRRNEVRDITFELIMAARQYGEPVTIAVIASDPHRLAARVNVAGVDEVVVVRSGQHEYAADTYLQATEALVLERQPSLVLSGFTVDGMGFAPAVAARLNLGFASDIIAFRRGDDGLVAEREFYGGKARGEIAFPDKKAILLMLRPTCWMPAEGAGSAAVTEAALVLEEPRMRHREFLEPEDRDFDISGSDFILAVGRGIGDRENIGLFAALAEKVRADLAVSRPLVDAGWAPASRQVGQSGKTVKPKVYLAFGISGAIQHLAGMKTAARILAINTDPEAPIFNIAHYGAVADLFEVAEELEKLY